MASMKFEEVVALRARRGGMTKRRDDHKRNGGVDHSRSAPRKSPGAPCTFGSGSAPPAKAFSETVTAQ
jgi:hypothetical protein